MGKHTATGERTCKATVPLPKPHGPLPQGPRARGSLDSQRFDRLANHLNSALHMAQEPSQERQPDCRHTTWTQCKVLRSGKVQTKDQAGPGLNNSRLVFRYFRAPGPGGPGGPGPGPTAGGHRPAAPRLRRRWAPAADLAKARR